MNTPFELEKLDWQVVELPLARPLATSTTEYSTRQVIVIRARVRVGAETVVGFGEASPLAGWTDETVDSCIDTLASLELPARFDSVRSLDEVFGTLKDDPSARFGVELALLDAVARHREVPICRLLAAERGRMPLASVPVQYTLGAATVEETVAEAKDAWQRGFRCIKLKVGVATPVADIARVGRVREACPHMKIRLDANGAWSLDEAADIVGGLANAHIDLVEQPVQDRDFAALLDTVHDPAEAGAPGIAPDESCVPAERARSLIADDRIGAVVLKPQTMGGILPTCDLIDDARRNETRVVLSTLIESAIGRHAVAHLAAAYPDVPGPHGLATGAWFASDVTDKADLVDNGHLRLRYGPGLGFEPSWRAR